LAGVGEAGGEGKLGPVAGGPKKSVEVVTIEDNHAVDRQQPTVQSAAGEIGGEGTKVSGSGNELSLGFTISAEGGTVGAEVSVDTDELKESLSNLGDAIADIPQQLYDAYATLQSSTSDEPEDNCGSVPGLGCTNPVSVLNSGGNKQDNPK
jgi:hypothetical protein